MPKANLTVFAQPHLGVAFRCSFAKFAKLPVKFGQAGEIQAVFQGG